ncbi:MAG: DUF4271 domain-containing protein [Tannerella sp.]|jgi:hypothetical protein|nr:DUF4271 domain-containing protein [Tannerella sp.]
MDNADFEGFTGILLGDTTFSNDVLLLVALLLLSVFAVIFRFNAPLFGKMISNISAGEQRHSIFETTEKDSFLFNSFMIFQAMILSGVLIFLTLVEYGYFPKPGIASTLILTGMFSVFIFIFYLFRNALYAIFGYIFIGRSAYKMMFTNHNALFCTFGILLYIPVLWILLIGKYFFMALIVVIISYLSFRIILVFRFIYIFLNKNTGLLFLSLYLCALEIVPLVLFYEGLIYIYNIIETNNICQ